MTIFVYTQKDDKKPPSLMKKARAQIYGDPKRARTVDLQRDRLAL